ncbi:hypothetical protein [uncultured Tateyamaria sp.]|uniref:hypothetical protein n=1 Tax=uncultured Tateyamaria sp. TaxID=455651 RepID=UPI00262DCB69|nr:hypothetical protein [uncultured Tateyamaria sp.]
MKTTVNAVQLLVGQTVKYLPLAYVINMIVVHLSVGYSHALEASVGPDVLERATNPELAMLEGDFIIWSNARFSYWSDMLAASLSPAALYSIAVYSLALGLVSLLPRIILSGRAARTA